MKALVAVLAIGLVIALVHHLAVKKCREAGNIDLSQINVRVFAETPLALGLDPGVT